MAVVTVVERGVATAVKWDRRLVDESVASKVLRLVVSLVDAKAAI